jgi:hypothetical protein
MLFLWPRQRDLFLSELPKIVSISNSEANDAEAIIAAPMASVWLRSLSMGGAEAEPYINERLTACGEFWRLDAETRITPGLSSAKNTTNTRIANPKSM